MVLVLQVVVSATTVVLLALDLVELLVLRIGAASSPLLQLMVLQSLMTTNHLHYLAIPVLALEMVAVATFLKLVSITLLILWGNGKHNSPLRRPSSANFHHIRA